MVIFVHTILLSVKFLESFLGFEFWKLVFIIWVGQKILSLKIIPKNWSQSSPNPLPQTLKVVIESVGRHCRSRMRLVPMETWCDSSSFSSLSTTPLLLTPQYILTFLSYWRRNCLFPFTSLDWLRSISAICSGHCLQTCRWTFQMSYRSHWISSLTWTSYFLAISFSNFPDSTFDNFWTNRWLHTISD